MDTCVAMLILMSSDLKGGVTAVEQNTAAGWIPTPHISEDLFQVAEINGINHDWSAGGQ